MPEVRTTNLRFNLGKESQRKAWQYLRTMDKSVFKSYSQAVATAVVDYFDRYYQTQDDPYLERGRARNSLCSKSWMQCGMLCGRRCRSFWQGA